MYSYTKNQILQELRIKIIKREHKKEIAQWSYERFLERIKDMDHELEQLLIDLSCMQEEDTYNYNQLEDKVAVLCKSDVFVYDRLEFAKELRRFVYDKKSMIFLANWAHDVFQYRTDDKIVHDIAYTLSLMCCHEFER